MAPSTARALLASSLTRCIMCDGRPFHTASIITPKIRSSVNVCLSSPIKFTVSALSWSPGYDSRPGTRLRQLHEV